MNDSVISQLNQWGNFYVIVGSSAGALTGLQFVVIALIDDAKAAGSMRQIRAFGTPTIVHFCLALLVSAILCAPWHALTSVSIVLAATGIAGVLYQAMVVRHARAQTGYQPDLEDWLWYAGLPLLAHATLTVAAILIPLHPVNSLFAIAGVVLALLFIGIHNAWDTVTYITVRRSRASKEPSS